MAEEEVGPELPGKPFNVNPPSSEPHAGVVVEIAGFHQFAGEVVHDGDRAFTGFAESGTCPYAFGLRVFLQRRELIEVGRPQLGPEREPVFPIAPPIDFLGEFFDGRCGVSPEGRCGTFGFENQSVPDRRGESRNMGVAGNNLIPCACIASGEGNEGIKLLKRILAGE